jgi:predicted enzyme related to lactoylglutathione lyase
MFEISVENFGRAKKFYESILGIKILEWSRPPEQKLPLAVGAEK